MSGSSVTGLTKYYFGGVLPMFSLFIYYKLLTDFNVNFIVSTKYDGYTWSLVHIIGVIVIISVIVSDLKKENPFLYHLINFTIFFLQPCIFALTLLIKAWFKSDPIRPLFAANEYWLQETKTRPQFRYLTAVSQNF